MEFGQEVLDGLQTAGETTEINDKCFKIICEHVIDGLLHLKNAENVANDKNLKSIDSAILKQTYSVLMAFVLEAAKHDSSQSNISSVLEDSKFSAERIQLFNEVYKKHAREIQRCLSMCSSTLPHIVDVDWRLDYYIKNNHLDKVNKPTYLISLKTEQTKQTDSQDLQFSCTMEQLQDLVGKLKDATKAMEKLSQ